MSSCTRAACSLAAGARGPREKVVEMLIVKQLQPLKLKYMTRRNKRPLHNTPSVSKIIYFFILNLTTYLIQKFVQNITFFCCELLYQYTIFKNDLNLTIFVFFLNETSG